MLCSPAAAAEGRTRQEQTGWLHPLWRKQGRLAGPAQHAEDAVDHLQGIAQGVSEPLAVYHKGAIETPALLPAPSYEMKPG